MRCQSMHKTSSRNEVVYVDSMTTDGCFAAASAKTQPWAKCISVWLSESDRAGFIGLISIRIPMQGEIGYGAVQIGERKPEYPVFRFGK